MSNQRTESAVTPVQVFAFHVTLLPGSFENDRGSDLLHRCFRVTALFAFRLTETESEK